MRIARTGGNKGFGAALTTTLTLLTCGCGREVPAPAPTTTRHAANSPDNQTVAQDSSDMNASNGFPLPLIEEMVAGHSETPATNSNDSVRNTARHEGKAVEVEVPPVRPLDDWPQPSAALVLSGEQYGYLEPCGCSENQSGGMARRGGLVHELADRGWSVAGLDIGGTVHRSRRQSQLKFETLMEEFRILNYRALGLGVEDLQLTADYLLTRHDLDSPNAVRFLAANVTFYGDPELGTPAATASFELNHVRIGVTSILGESWQSKLLPDGGSDQIQFKPPREVLSAAIARLQSESADLVILMSYASLDESRKLAAGLDGVDLVVSAGGPEDPEGIPESIGSTRLVTVGRKGKHVGVLGFYPEHDAGQRLRFKLVTLDRGIVDDDPRMIEQMRLYQQRLRGESIVGSPDLTISHPSDAEFIGAAACGECHTKAFEIWKSTPHALAFASLDPANHRQGHERLKGISRVFDPECLCCHVTGWDPQEVFRYEGGFINEEYAGTDELRAMFANLQGNGCENCHGPGSRHRELINAGDDVAAVKEVRVTKQQAKDKVCNSCHDLDNSPHFEFEPYWEDVKHYGLD